MPDIKTFEALATGHGVGTALLIMACSVLVAAVITLYRQNQALYTRIETLLSERVASLEHLLLEGGRADGRRSSR
jgi:hypothetical protein